jgi:hypothetical protein
VSTEWPTQDARNIGIGTPRSTVMMLEVIVALILLVVVVVVVVVTVTILVALELVVVAVLRVVRVRGRALGRSRRGASRLADGRSGALVGGESRLTSPQGHDISTIGDAQHVLDSPSPSTSSPLVDRR